MSLRKSAWLRACLAVTAILGLAQSWAAHAQESAQLLRFPDIHDDMIVFVKSDAIWVVDAIGSPARRLEAKGERPHNLRISPDGSQLAYSAWTNGNVDVFVASLDGLGDGRRITHHPAADIMVDWHSNGRDLFFVSTMQSPRATYNQLYIVGSSGGLPERHPLPYVETATYAANGSEIVFTYLRDFQEEAWKRYYGGRAPDLWSQDLTTGETKRLTTHPTSDSVPMAVGGMIYFLSERDANGRGNLWRLPLGGGGAEQVSFFTDTDVRHPSSDGSRIVYEAAGRLFVYDPANSENIALDVTLSKSDDGESQNPFTVSERVVSARFDKSRRNAVLLEARGDIFDLDVRSGEARNLTASSGTAERYPSVNRRGDVAFHSDRNGEYALYLLAAGTGESRKVADFGQGLRYRPHWSPDGDRVVLYDHKNVLWLVDLRDGRKVRVDQGLWWYHGDLVDLPVSWSPDGRWVAYSRGLENRNNAVFVFDTHRRELHQVTSGAFDDYAVEFDKTGNYLLTLSNRNFSPTYGDIPVDATWTYRDATVVAAVPLRSDIAAPGAPGWNMPDARQSVAIEFDGIEQRMRVLTAAPGRLGALRAMEGGFVLIRRDESENVLERYRLGEDKHDTLQREARLSLEDVEGTRVLTRAGAKVFLITGGNSDPKEIDLSGLNVPSDRKSESKQMFADAWRFSRDFYYDPGLHGADWDAVKHQYEPLIEHVTNDEELTFVIREMLGELNGGHVYASARAPEPRGDARDVGLLGVDFGRDEHGYRIDRIYRTGSRNFAIHSPLDDPSLGVSEGDYLLAVDGKALSVVSDPWEAFAGLADKEVELTIAPSADPSAARKIIVKTLVSERKLRELAWVEENRRKVEQLSQGKVGYIYVPNTGAEGLNELMIQYRSQFTKAALIVDERFNTGGALGDRLVELLNRPPLVMFSARNSRDYSLPELAHRGPKAMLINGWSYSGGDGFPLLFKTAGLGPLIGERTWGGLIGPGMRMELINGGFVSPAPQRVYTVEGKWAEGNEGVRPDIAVSNDPGELIRGVDRQLETAVELMLEEIKDMQPIPEPRHPAPNDWNPANRGDDQ